VSLVSKIKVSKWTVGSSVLSDRLIAFLTNCELNKQHLTVGINETTKNLASVKFLIVFVDAGNLVNHLLPLAFSAGVPCSALSHAPPQVTGALKVKRLACLGVKQTAHEISDFPELLLEVQRCPAIEDVPFGNCAQAKQFITDTCDTGNKAKKKPQPPSSAKAAAKTPVAQKRFFSSLD
jgi:hypothetical protein